MGVVPHKAEADSPLARMDIRVASVDPATASAVRRPAAYSRRALWAFTLGMSIRTTSSGLVPAVTRTYICVITVKNMRSYCQVTCNYCQSMLEMSIRTTSSGLVPAVTRTYIRVITVKTCTATVRLHVVTVKACWRCPSGPLALAWSQQSHAPTYV